MKYVFILLLVTLSITSAFDKNLTNQETILIPDEPAEQITTKNHEGHESPRRTRRKDFNFVGSNISCFRGNSSAENFPILGRIECVGGTCYDWVNGPCATWCVNDAANGIHVTWLWSNTEAMNDRNMRYNFYDWSTNTWNWIDTANYMNSGVNVFSHTMTSVAGGSDLDRTTGNFVISGNYSSSGSMLPELARDLVPGGGLFEYSQGPLGWRWPFMAISQNQSIHVACADVITTDSLYYTRCSPWGTWTTPINICPPQPSPLFPNYNIAAGKISNKVAIVWEESEPVGPQDRAFYRESYDNGVNWGSPAQLPFPPSAGFAPSFGVSSLFAMYDGQDNLHIVASVSDTGVTVPAEIWHWCPQNTPNWSLIHHYDPDTLTGPVGYNAIFTCRPSIIQESATNNFYVTWEQFDSLNYEPLTGRARADIHIAQSNNNGQTWNGQTRITDPNTTSKRFPVVGGVQVTPSPSDKDTLLILYMVDSIAGAFLQTEHRFCVNPMVLHRVPVPLATSIKEESGNWNLESWNLSASPNPFNTYTTIRYSLPRASKASLEIYDVTGKLIKTFPDNQNLTTNNTINWHRTDNHGKKVPAGIYYFLLKTNNKLTSKKIIIN